MIFKQRLLHKNIAFLGLLLALASCSIHAMKRTHDGDASEESSLKSAKSDNKCTHNSALIPWYFSQHVATKRIDCTSAIPTLVDEYWLPIGYDTCKVIFDQKEECLQAHLIVEELDLNIFSQDYNIVASRYLYMPLNTYEPTNDKNVFGEYSSYKRCTIPCENQMFLSRYLKHKDKDKITVGWNKQHNGITINRIPSKESESIYPIKSYTCCNNNEYLLGHDNPIAYSEKNNLIAVMLDKKKLLLITPQPFQNLEKLSDIRYRFK